MNIEEIGLRLDWVQNSIWAILCRRKIPELDLRTGEQKREEARLKKEKEQKEIRLKAQRKARKLLHRLITPSQWKQFILEGFFTQKDGKGRIWKFFARQHYPIECEEQQICIDVERGAPDEDLLLQVWLEIIGGRHQELLPNIGCGCHYDYIIQDDLIDGFRHIVEAQIDQQMLAKGLSGSALHAQARQTAIEMEMEQFSERDKMEE